MKNLFFVFLFFLFNIELSAQSFYVSSFHYGNGPGTFDHYKLHKVTIKPGGGLISEDLNNCGGEFYSLGANSKGFYWFSYNGIHRGELNDLTLSNCSTMQTSSNVYSNSLAIGPDNKAYYTTGNLISMDLTTMQTTNLGRLPYQASGDLTFYRGELYMASFSGLVKVDVQNTANSYVYMPLVDNVFGLVSVSTGLRKNTVYAIRDNYGTTEIYELDIENKRTVGLVGTLPYLVYDAASPVEDGGVLGINIEKINLQQDCAQRNKGVAEVITTTHTDVFTYQLSNGMTNTTGIFSGLSAGNYRLTIVSPKDQQETDFVVPAYSDIKPSYKYTVQQQVCDAPGQVVFNGTGSTGALVKLHNEAFPINHTFKDLNAGTYEFAILTESGCEVEKVTVVVPRDKCIIQFDRTEVAKECNSVSNSSVTAITKPHPDEYSYTLNGITNKTGIFNDLPPGSYNLQIHSPEDSKTIPIVTPDHMLSSPAINYSTVAPVCDALGAIKLTTDKPGQYQIQTNGGIFNFDHTFTGLSAGLHRFKILDLQKCLVKELDVALTPAKCTIKFDKIVTSQQCDVIYKGTMQVATKPHHDQYTYTLNGESNLTGYFKNLSAGDHLLKITSPEDVLSVPFNVPDYRKLQPEIKTLITDNACATKGTIKFLFTDEASNYKISYKGTTYQPDHIFADLAVGKYQFTVLKKDGCIVDTYEAEIYYQPCPIVINNINAAAECNVLFKGFVTVTCPPIPETYSYTLNGVTNQTGVFNMLSPGNYPLTVTASGGGTPQTREVVVPDFSLDKPLTVVNAKMPVCDISGNIGLIVANASQYNIRFNSSVYPGEHIFTNLFAGQYHFDILKKNGCIVDAFDVTLIRETCSPVTFPTAFTPNGDGINDLFRADPTSKATNFNLKIFDRTGNLLYQATDLHNGWDGTADGKPLPFAVYYYLVTLTDQTNKPLTRTGTVTLLR